MDTRAWRARQALARRGQIPRGCIPDQDGLSLVVRAGIGHEHQETPVRAATQRGGLTERRTASHGIGVEDPSLVQFNIITQDKRRSRSARAGKESDVTPVVAHAMGIGITLADALPSRQGSKIAAHPFQGVLGRIPQIEVRVAGAAGSRHARGKIESGAGEQDLRAVGADQWPEGGIRYGGSPCVRFGVFAHPPRGARVRVPQKHIGDSVRVSGNDVGAAAHESHESAIPRHHGFRGRAIRFRAVARAADEGGGGGRAVHQEDLPLASVLRHSLEQHTAGVRRDA